MKSAAREVVQDSHSFRRKFSNIRLIGKNRKKPSHESHGRLRISQLCAAVDEIAVAMKMECKRVESEFLRVGNDLAALYNDSGKLSEDVGKSARRISEESDLYSMADMAEETLGSLEQSRASVKGTMNGISGMVDCLGDLYTTCGIIEKISMVLRVVGLNMGIECSRSADSRELFQVVSGETSLLSEKIIEIARQIRRESSLARNNQMLMLNEVASVGDDLENLQKEAAESVGRGVQQVEELIGFSVETLQDAERRSSVIYQRISDVVMAMQSHDNITQRIEHISKALMGIQDRQAKETKKGEARKGRKERLAATYDILKIQSAQLSDIISEIEAWHEKAGKAFGSVYKELKILVQHLSKLGQDENDQERFSDQDGADDPFSVLGHALKSLRKIIERGQELKDRVGATAKETTETTKKLEIKVEEVMRISKETHIMALNAIVKAARLGDKGRTLEALAQEVRNLSDQSEGFVKDVQEILERSYKASESLGEGIIGGPKVETESIEKESNLDRIIQRISVAGDKFKNDSLHVFECANEVTDGFRKRKTSLDFLPELASKLRKHLEEMQSIELMLKPRGGWKEKSERDTQGITNYYTMKKERDIHGQVVGSLPSCNAEGKSAIRAMIEEGIINHKNVEENEKEKIGADDEFGSNVELF